MALVVDFIGVRVALESTKLFFVGATTPEIWRSVFPPKWERGLMYLIHLKKRPSRVLTPKKENVVKRFLIYCVL